MRPEVTGKKILALEERFGVTVGIATAYSGISRSRIYELLADGTLEGKILSRAQDRRRSKPHPYVRRRAERKAFHLAAASR